VAGVDSPSPEHVDRFRADLRRLLGEAPSAERPLGLAVSGGPDSLALLLLARTALPDMVAAATVDHGLRPEAAEEARFVAALCERIGVRHDILRPATPISGSIQLAARATRYALLDEWRAASGLAAIATAHHADDQAETLLMRLNRSSGVGGLAGIRPTNRAIVRPLLGWRRSELGAIVAAAGIVAVDDPSNANPRFDRVRIRRALAAADWIDPEALARSAAHLGQAEDAIAWAVERLAAERIAHDADAVTFDAAGLPAEFVRRLLVVAIARIDPACRPEGSQIERIVTTLGAGHQATIGAVLVRPGPRWLIEAAPPRRN